MWAANSEYLHYIHTLIQFTRMHLQLSFYILQLIFTFGLI